LQKERNHGNWSATPLWGRKRAGEKGGTGKSSRPGPQLRKTPHWTTRKELQGKGKGKKT